VTVTTRTAVPGDAAAIAHVHVAAWRAAYRGLMPDHVLDGLDEHQRAESWERLLASGETESPTFVAEVDGEVAGFVALGPSKDEGQASVAGEVYAIYVRPDAWGSGTGRVLMELALSTLGDRSLSRATLWVLEGNERARAFYESAGWEPDGAVREDDSRGFRTREVRYTRALT